MMYVDCTMITPTESLVVTQVNIQENVISVRQPSIVINIKAKQDSRSFNSLIYAYGKKSKEEEEEEEENVNGCG